MSPCSRSATEDREAHAVSGGNRDRLGWAYEILGMAQVAVMRAEHDRAARLLGATTAALERFGERLNPVDQRMLDQSASACRDAYGHREFEDAWEAGRALDPKRALEEAFARTGGSGDRTETTDG